MRAARVRAGRTEECLLSKRRIPQGCSMKLCKAVIGMAIAAGTLGLSGLCAAQTCSGPPPSIAIAKTADLNFGSLAVTASAGTAVIDPATGNRSVTGGASPLGSSGFNAAGFRAPLCAAAGPDGFDVV